MSFSTLFSNIISNVAKYKDQEKVAFNEPVAGIQPTVTPQKKLGDIAGPPKEQPAITQMLYKEAPELEDQVGIPEFIKPILNTALQQSVAGKKFDKEDPEQAEQLDKYTKLLSATKPKERFKEFPSISAITPQEAKEGAQRVSGELTPEIELEQIFGKIQKPTELKGITEEEALAGKERMEKRTLEGAVSPVAEAGAESIQTTVKALHSVGLQVAKTGLTTLRSAAEFDPGMGVESKFAKENEELLQNITTEITDLTSRQAEIRSTVEGPIQEALFDVANAGTSFGLAIGTFYLTKNPSLAAGLLSTLESSDFYNNARNAGKTPGEALAIAAAAGVGTFYLEKAGLDFFIKNIGGPLSQVITRSFSGFLAEGGQEAAQTVWQNLVTKVGLDKSQALLEGTARSFAIGGLVGGVATGAGTAIQGEVEDPLIKYLNELDAKTLEASISEHVVSESEKLTGQMQGNFKEARLVGKEGIPRKGAQRPGIEKPAPAPVPEPEVPRGNVDQKLSDIRSELSKRTMAASADITKSTAALQQGLKDVAPKRAEQEEIYSFERGGRMRRILEERKQLRGMTGFEAEKAILKGEYSKVEFESLRDKVSEQDRDNLVNAINISPAINEWEKLPAKVGLSKFFTEKGVVVPTKGEIDLLKKVFPGGVMDALTSRQSILTQAKDIVGEALNIPRTLMTSFDLSAPLRQGIFMLGRPKQFFPAFAFMFKQFASSKAYKAYDQEMRKDPLFTAAMDGKLDLTTLEGGVNEQEEAFYGYNYAEKIPLVGIGVRASGRAYTGFLNKLRFDVFKDIYTKAENSGVKITQNFIESLASFINSATGRGNWVDLKGSAKILNGFFFSPKLMQGRVDMFNPAMYIKIPKVKNKRHPFVRKEALKTLLSTSSIVATLIGLASMIPGAEVEKDSRNSDFGKVKVGNTRIDLCGGFQQYVVLGARLWTGESISSMTGKTTTLGEGYKPLTRTDIIARFFSFKESPVASFVVGLINGQDALGNEFVPTEQVINRFVPMVVSDIYDLYKDGSFMELGLSPIAVFGGGLQTYGQQELVFGEDPFGKSKAQIKSISGLAEDAYTWIFGEKEIGSSTTASVQKYDEQLLKLPEETRQEVFGMIWEKDETLARKLLKVANDRVQGITPAELTLKDKGVANGDRANAIWKKIKDLDREEKKIVTDDYWDKKIITDDVWTQLESLNAKSKE